MELGRPQLLASICDGSDDLTEEQMEKDLLTMKSELDEANSNIGKLVKKHDNQNAELAKSEVCLTSTFPLIERLIKKKQSQE